MREKNNYFEFIDNDDMSGLKLSLCTVVENHRNINGDTILHYAVKMNKTNILSKFFEDWGPCLNVKNNDGKTVRDLLNEKNDDNYLKKLNGYADNLMYYSINRLERVDGGNYLIQTNNNNVYVEKEGFTIKKIQKLKLQDIQKIEENREIKIVKITNDFICSDSINELDQQIYSLTTPKNNVVTEKKEKIMMSKKLEFIDAAKLKKIEMKTEKYLRHIEKIIDIEKEKISEIKEWIDYVIEKESAEGKNDKEKIIEGMLEIIPMGNKQDSVNKEHVLQNYVLNENLDDVIDIAFTFELTKEEFIDFLNLLPEEFEDKLETFQEKLDDGNEVKKEEFLDYKSRNEVKKEIEIELSIEELLEQEFIGENLETVLNEKFNDTRISCSKISDLISKHGPITDSIKTIIKHNIFVKSKVEVNISDQYVEKLVNSIYSENIPETNEIKAEINKNIQYGKDIMLVEAIKENDIELITELLENGSNINAEIRGTTPFLIAITKMDYTAIIMLIEEFGADIDAQDYIGRKTMDMAILTGDINKIITLREAGTDIRDKDIELAYEMGQGDIIGYFEVESMIEQEKNVKNEKN